MLELDDLFFAEFSLNQKAFHIQTIKESIEQNKRILTYGGHSSNDFIPIGIFNNFLDANDFIKKYKLILLESGTLKKNEINWADYDDDVLNQYGIDNEKRD